MKYLSSEFHKNDKVAKDAAELYCSAISAILTRNNKKFDEVIADMKKPQYRASSLALGISLSSYDAGGKTLHGHCVDVGNLHAAKALIAAGVDVNARYGRSGTTPLIGAAENGDVEMTKLLLALGADVNAKGGFLDNTPLHVATHAKQDELTIVLLLAGASTSEENRIKEKPVISDEVQKFLVGKDLSKPLKITRKNLKWVSAVAPSF